MSQSLRPLLDEHHAALEQFFATYEFAWKALSEHCAKQIQNGAKLFFCGNGGSACDAMHIAGEFVGRFKRERQGLPAIALSADSGILTAIGNDYGFDEIFSRQVEALAKQGDFLFAMSTSGSSPNVLKALKTARNLGLVTVLLTGEKGKIQHAQCDELFAVSSTNTARIQEVHLFALHTLAEWVETLMPERS